ncbi:hypothetical protein GWL_10140 [Herbaspirillum sp. GW103]|nr:hypothetical protein GWL_10140 [Herbaspirillum sp. GW103]
MDIVNGAADKDLENHTPQSVRVPHRCHEAGAAGRDLLPCKDHASQPRIAEIISIIGAPGGNPISLRISLPISAVPARSSKVSGSDHTMPAHAPMPIPRAKAERPAAVHD